VEVEEIAKGRITLSSYEEFLVHRLIELTGPGRDQPEKGVALALHPETADLVHVVLKCGVAAIEEGGVRFGPIDLNRLLP